MQHWQYCLYASYNSEFTSNINWETYVYTGKKQQLQSQYQCHFVSFHATVDFIATVWKLHQQDVPKMERGTGES